MKMRYFWPILLALLSGCTLDTAIYPELLVDLNSNDGNLSTREDDELYDRIHVISVRLSKQPSADVTVHTSVDISGEVAILEEELVFTSENYHESQTINYMGVGDDVVDGDRQVLLTLTASSSDPSFNGRKFDCTILNVDVDMPRIILEYSSLETSEDGTSVEIGASLSSKPLAPVTVPVKVSDPLEASVSPKELRFDPNNWNTQQTVTVTGLPDNTVDGDKKYNLEFGDSESDDENYNGIQTEPIELINKDVDQAGFDVGMEGSFNTKEGGGERLKIYIKLKSIPTSDVSIDLGVSDETEAEVLPTQLVFTSENWNKVQWITVRGLDDDEFDGKQQYDVIFSSARSEDLNYNGKIIDPISMVNIDDDTLDVDVFDISTTELVCGEENASFKMRLTKRPTKNITVELKLIDKKGNPIDGLQFNSPLLIFDPESWDTPKEVIVQPPSKDGGFDKAYYKYVYLDTRLVDVEEPSHSPVLLFSLRAFCDPDKFTDIGDGIKVELPPGYYEMEVVGAGGGSYDTGGSSYYSYGGVGAKARAIFALKQVQTAFVHVGGKGGSCYNGRNGGGSNGGACGSDGMTFWGYGGGGASDIRIGLDTYDRRVIVAGGGGGGLYIDLAKYKNTIGAGAGGRLGGNGKKGTSAHDATLGGGLNGCNEGNDSQSCGFGKPSANANGGRRGGGGGGWFSGLSGQDKNVSGAGGSSYIHGWISISDRCKLDNQIIEYYSNGAYGQGAARDTNGYVTIKVYPKEIETEIE